jgi:hypothetical protein
MTSDNDMPSWAIFLLLILAALLGLLFPVF